ncbi:MAG: hypothetical protein H7X79_08005, partial [Sporomusaceae bacterium]|nr:hypothetical protein [Sporomusaceae bacterium]
TTDIAPFSVRVNDDVKARLKQLQEESGANQPDFYRSLVALYIDNKGLREAKTQEEEDIIGALAVISNSTIALINRLGDNKKAQKKSAERYAIDLEDLNIEIENMREYNVSLAADLEKANAENNNLKEQLENMERDMQAQIEKINHEAAREIEIEKSNMKKKLKNLQTVADTISEIKEQGKYDKESLKKTEKEISQFIEIANQEKAKVSSLETANTEMRMNLESRNADISRLQSEIDAIKESSVTLSLQLSHEAIAKNRAEAKLEVLEPQLHALNKEIHSMRTAYAGTQQNR